MTSGEDSAEWVPLKTAAGYLDRDAGGLRDLARSGQIEAKKHNRKWYVPREAVERLKAEQVQERARQLAAAPDYGPVDRREYPLARRRLDPLAVADSLTADRERVFAIVVPAHAEADLILYMARTNTWRTTPTWFAMGSRVEKLDFQEAHGLSEDGSGIHVVSYFDKPPPRADVVVVPELGDLLDRLVATFGPARKAERFFEACQQARLVVVFDNTLPAEALTLFAELCGKPLEGIHDPQDRRERPPAFVVYDRFGMGGYLRELERAARRVPRVVVAASSPRTLRYLSHFAFDGEMAICSGHHQSPRGWARHLDAARGLGFNQRLPLASSVDVEAVVFGHMAATLHAAKFVSLVNRVTRLLDPVIHVMVTDSPRRYLETEPTKIEGRLTTDFERVAPDRSDPWRSTLVRLAAVLQAHRNRDRADPVAAFEDRARERGYDVLRAGSQGRSPDSWREAKTRAHADMAAEILEAQRHLADAGVGRSWAKELVERLWYLGVEQIEPDLADALAKDFAFAQKLTIGVVARHDALRDPRARDRAASREAHFDGALGDGPHQLARQAVEALQLGSRPWELPVGTQLTIGDSWTPHPARKTAFLRDRLRVPQSHLEPEDPEVAALLQLLGALAIPARPDGAGGVVLSDGLARTTADRAARNLLARGEDALKGGADETLHPARLPPLSFADWPEDWDDDL